MCNAILSMDKVEALLYILAKTDVQDEIIRLNQEEQLVKQNVFSDGAKTPEYSEGYYNLKKRFFPQTGRNMNFRLTGDFFGTFDINILSNGDIEISANGDKGDRDLFEVYGIEILGLTEESKESLIPLFEEYLLEYVTAKMEGTYKN